MTAGARERTTACEESGSAQRAHNSLKRKTYCSRLSAGTDPELAAGGFGE